MKVCDMCRHLIDLNNPGIEYVLCGKKKVNCMICYEKLPKELMKEYDERYERGF